jgi:nitrogen regulatory protein PII
MADTRALENDALPLEPARRILAILPDDGTDHRLLEALRRDHGVTRADSVLVRGVAVLQRAKTRRGRLPEPVLARLVTIIVDAAAADAVFAYVCDTARIGRPGGGAVLLERLTGATAYRLPEPD